MATLDELKGAVSEYVSDFRRHNLPEFIISDYYDLFPKGDYSQLDCQYQWPAKWPNAELPGVYAFIDLTLDVVYIGKASMKNTLGMRLSKYCVYDQNRDCRLYHNGWTNPPRYVWTLGVPSALTFEAPALEEFLIQRLQPIDNSTGKKL